MVRRSRSSRRSGGGAGAGGSSGTLSGPTCFCLQLPTLPSRCPPGLGDVAIPGLLACLALRYDASRVVDLRTRGMAVASALQDALGSMDVSWGSGWVVPRKAGAGLQRLDSALCCPLSMILHFDAHISRIFVRVTPPPPPCCSAAPRARRWGRWQ